MPKVFRKPPRRGQLTAGLTKRERDIDEGAVRMRKRKEKKEGNPVESNVVHSGSYEKQIVEIQYSFYILHSHIRVVIGCYSQSVM